MRQFWDLVHQVHMCKLTDHQMGILAAIMLMSRDRPSLKQPEDIDKIQEQLIEILQVLIQQESCQGDRNVSVAKLRACLKFIVPIQTCRRFENFT